jgi:deoxyribose-phosphate aldolase
MSDPIHADSAWADPARADPMETLVRAITEEVLARLADANAAPAGECAEVCADCDGRCASKCAGRVHSLMDAGADRISAAGGLSDVERSIAALIDHTLLKPDASRREIVALCREAVDYGFASVCVNPAWVSLAAELTHGSGVNVCTVIGFPLGAGLTSVKMFEAEEAVKLGAQELDMVMNVGALKSGQDQRVEADIRAVVETAHRCGALCKVILETALLTGEEKVRATLAAARAGADFVKTSTGFASSGATVQDVALIGTTLREAMRAAVERRIGIKAAGGVRTLDDVQKLVGAGATRIGASASVRILREAHALLAAEPVEVS